MSAITVVIINLKFLTSPFPSSTNSEEGSSVTPLLLSSAITSSFAISLATNGIKNGRTP